MKTDAIIGTTGEKARKKVLIMKIVPVFVNVNIIFRTFAAEKQEMT